MSSKSNTYDFNCPMFVRFSSDSFQDSLKNISSSPEKDMDFSNQNSSIEKSLTDNEEEDVSSTVSSDEIFVVHTHSTRNQEKKLKTKATIPRPFKFRTDDRVKDTNSDNCLAKETKEFTSQLRQHKPPQHTTFGITKVKPFNLTEAKKRKQEEDHYLPLAEQVNIFQNKTPDRYHTASQKEFQPQEHWSPKRLRPRTPNLQAVKRHRAINALSREEEEAKVLEEMKAYEFHAKPVDPKIYQPTVFEIKETKTTKAKNIQLQTAQRSQPKQEESSEATYQFRARPVPKNILSGPVGLGEKPKINRTKPKSPNFTTEKRLEKRKLLEQQNEAKEQPAKKPKLVKPKKIKEAPKEIFKPKRTEIQPFSFDKVDQKRFALKERKIQEEIEKENKPFVFKAQTLPSCEASKLPEVKKKPVTRAQPFNFCLENRSSKRSFSFTEESISFKAQPATVLSKAPFIPEKPAKQSIDFKEFELHTDRRASERLKQQEIKEAKKQEEEKLLFAQKAEEEENERREVLKLRQELVHKANPIRQFKPVEIKPSSIPLTKAKTPDFQTDKRLRARHEK